MLPYKTLIALDKTAKMPQYQQIAQQMMALIRQGVLAPGQRVPSTRQLSELLEVHRKTITQVYDELIVQGWLETKAAQGTYVAKHLPEIKPQKLAERPLAYPKTAGFSFEYKTFIKREVIKAFDGLHLDDGFPDPRLVPLEDLAKAYRTNLSRGNTYQKLGYGETKGTVWLRQQLADYLHETRGLKVGVDNIQIVRGTVMGMYLTNMAFVKPGDAVVMGAPSWFTAKISFMQAGAVVYTIPVDEHGMVVDALEALCQKQEIRMVYVTPHHHYPTTVMLRADRRIKLLKLAQQFRFIVFEDDYDYDFHYQSKPLLPLASADMEGLVLYSGSFTKSISPAFRVGYLVAPEEVIEYLSYHRRIIDRQGDNVLENAIAELLQEGVIQKYLRKAVREYRQRRDVFSDLLRQHLGHALQFQTPEGGMSVWAEFDRQINMEAIVTKALQQGLYLSSGVQHNLPEHNFNATRLGFASSTVSELEQCVEILKKVI